MVTDPATVPLDDARWQHRWERTHQLYLPGRDAALNAVFELVGVAEGAETWDQWWAAFRNEARVADLVAARDRSFALAHRSAECYPDLRWHLGALRRAGFGEVGEVWREHADAVVVGRR